MAKRLKKSDMITKVAVDNHIARTEAAVVVAVALEAAKNAQARDESFNKTDLRTMLRLSAAGPKKVKNLSAFDALLG